MFLIFDVKLCGLSAHRGINFITTAINPSKQKRYFIYIKAHIHRRGINWQQSSLSCMEKKETLREIDNNEFSLMQMCIQFSFLYCLLFFCKCVTMFKRPPMFKLLKNNWIEIGRRCFPSFFSLALFLFINTWKHLQSACLR